MPDETTGMPSGGNEEKTTDPVMVKSIYAMFRDVAERNRSTPALIFWKRRLTYDSVLNMVDSLGESMRSQLSLNKGERIGLLLPNSPPFAISLYASSKIGCIGVPINPRSSVREIENIVRHSGMKCLVTTESIFRKVKHLASAEMKILVARLQDFISLGNSIKFATRTGFHYLDHRDLGENILKFSDMIFTNDNGPEEDYDASDVTLLAYSGSTSMSPRAASLTHKNLWVNIQNGAEWFPRIERRTVTIASVPFHHSFALLLSLMVPLSTGSTTVLIDDHRNMENILNSITEYICDYFVGNPSIFRAMLERKDILKYRIGTVKVFISGGDTITEEFARHFEETTSSSIVSTYGTREVTGMSHINPLDRKKRKYGSIGVLIGSTEGKILDEDTGEEITKGTVGILAISGGQVMKEYWKNNDATEEVFREGWLLTGDIARVDSDGFYFIYERRKEAIVSDSSMVSAEEIEEVLRQNKKVKEVAVIGLPDERRGEIVKAYIRVEEGEKVTEKELREMCEMQLTEYKRPTIYEFRDEFPKNMDGQIIKRILKEESMKASGHSEKK